MGLLAPGHQWRDVVVRLLDLLYGVTEGGPQGMLPECSEASLEAGNAENTQVTDLR